MKTDLKNTLYLVRGTSGSGKSTLASILLKHLESEGVESLWLEADKYFTDSNGNYNWEPARLKEVHSRCYKETEEALALNKTVIVSNTFLTESEIKPYIELAKKYGYKPQVMLIQSKFTNVHGLDEAKLARQRSRLRADISYLL